MNLSHALFLAGTELDGLIPLAPSVQPCFFGAPHFRMSLLDIASLDTIVFDFDGVLTDDRVSPRPSDSHARIRKIAHFLLEKTGGRGVVREIMERLLCLDAFAQWLGGSFQNKPTT